MGKMEHKAAPFRSRILQGMYEGEEESCHDSTHLLPKQNSAVWFATAYLLFAASPTIGGLFPYPPPGDALDGGRWPLPQA